LILILPGIRGSTLSGGEKSSAERVTGDKAAAVALVPRPVRLGAGSGSFTLTPDAVIVADKASSSTAAKLSAYLKSATGWTLPTAVSGNLAKNSIVLSQDTSLIDLGLEGYLLDVMPQQIRLKAPTQAGLFYAVQTLRQLLPPEIYAGEAARDVAWKVPSVKIKDFPRFGWRGMMLDSGHDFQTLPFVLKFIDAMAAHKFNVFHWHLTDLGTWSIEI